MTKNRSTFAYQNEPREHKFYSSPEVPNPFHDSFSNIHQVVPEYNETSDNIYSIMPPTQYNLDLHQPLKDNYPSRAQIQPQKAPQTYAIPSFTPEIPNLPLNSVPNPFNHPPAPTPLPQNPPQNSQIMSDHRLEKALDRIRAQDDLINLLKSENEQLKHNSAKISENFEAEISHLKAQEAQFLTKIQSLEAKLEEREGIEKQFFSLKKDTESRQKDYSEKINNLHSKIESLEDELERQKDNYQKLKKEYDSLVDEQSGVNRKITKQEKTNQGLAKTLEGLNDEIKGLKAILKDKQSEIEQLQDIIEGLQQDTQQLQDDNAFLAEQHVDLRREHEELMNNHKNLKNQYENTSGLCINTKDDNAKLRNELRNQDIQIRKRDHEIEDLRQCIFILEGKNKELTEAINHHFYNQATDYKDRVLGILKQSEDPRRIRKIRDIGLEPSSLRLHNMLQQETEFRPYPDIDYKFRTQGNTSDIIRTQYRGRSVSPAPSTNDSKNICNINRPNPH